MFAYIAQEPADTRYRYDEGYDKADTKHQPFVWGEDGRRLQKVKTGGGEHCRYRKKE